MNHRFGVALIYGASIALWLFGALAAFGLLVWKAVGDPAPDAESPVWLLLGAVALAIGLTWWGMRWAKRRRTSRQDRIRVHARAAVDCVLASDRSSLEKNRRFLGLCVQIADPRLDHVVERLSDPQRRATVPEKLAPR